MGQESQPDIPTLKPGMDLKLPNEPQPDGGETARKLYADLQPSVVQIVTNDGRGSGFIADKEGRVVTDAHVVLGSREVYAVTADGTRYKAQIEKLDDIKDLAVIKMLNYEQGSIPALEIGSSHAKADQTIYALGHPRGYRPMYISPGYFQTQTNAAKEIENDSDEDDQAKLHKKMSRLTPKELDDAMADMMRPLMRGRVHIEPGNSGGPLVDAGGKVIGVSDMVDSKDTSKAYFNPAEDVKSILANKSKFDFTYAYEPSNFAKSYELKWQQNKGAAVLETGLDAGIGYLGYRAATRYPRLIGVGAGLYGLASLASDGSNYLNSTDSRDSWKYGTETASDASMVIGSAAMLIPRARTFGLIALGLGIAGNIGASFIPNHMVLKDMKRADGDPRPPYNPDAVLTNGLSTDAFHSKRPFMHMNQPELSLDAKLFQ